MQRRQFIKASLGGSALGLADSATRAKAEAPLQSEDTGKILGAGERNHSQVPENLRSSGLRTERRGGIRRAKTYSLPRRQIPRRGHGPDQNYQPDVERASSNASRTGSGRVCIIAAEV
jgi:hypothetical protein